MKKIVFLLLLSSFNINAQEIEFGEVSKEELANNVYEKDTTANAVILYKYRKTYFNHEHPNGYVLVTEVHQRIKILNTDGLDYATKEVNLYRDAKSKQRMSSIKGYTHNLVDGKVKTQKLKKSGIFENETSDNWTTKTITMPEAKVGSIVEWTYKINSPFWKIYDLEIQEEIPTKHYVAKIHTIGYFKFNRLVKGGYSINPKQYRRQRTLNVSYEQDTNSSLALTQATKSTNITTQEDVAEYEFKDIMPIKEEDYVNNIDNYRLVVTYELGSVQFPNSAVKNYAKTWDQVIKSINESDNFGDQLKHSKYLKEVTANLKAKSNSQTELMEMAFSYVRDHMTWNEKAGKYSRNGVRKAFKEKSGDVSEINLTLINLLRSLDIKANPVLVSTRSHGVPMFPTLEGFNYVVVCAELNGKEILMDATEKMATPGVLPNRTLNWEGTLVMADGEYRKINLFPRKKSQTNTIMSVTINDDGSLQGKRNRSYVYLDALKFRKRNKNRAQEEYLEELMNTNGLDDIGDFTRKNIDNLNKSVIESFTFEMDQGADLINDEMYFSPLFFLKQAENPFKLEERNYPVDFVYPYSRKKIISVKIPEGYTVKSIPKPLKIALPENLGSFLYNISQVEGGINVMIKLDINAPIIPSTKYGELKEFYKQRVLKETEKVILQKI